DDGAKGGRRGESKAVHQQESLALEVPSGGFQLPPLTLLNDLPALRTRGRSDPTEVARLLEQTLLSFGVEGKVLRWEQGPVVTRFEVQPAPGVRVQKFTSLTNDIALALAAPSVRIEAPIPGKSAVGIELPNQKTSLVHIKEILESDEYRRQSAPLTVALGKDIAGHPILGDLAEMPHLLIAGATGSGKSVMLNAIIAGLLFRCTPLDVRLLMIDPKRVEFTHFNNIPHLLAPVVTNPRAAAGALKEMLREMEERFERFAAAGVRNIQGYNQLPEGERLPYIVIVIDELADLMMVAPADFEDVICRLAQMTRATGIHMVLATQRPSVDVITGLIKANIPSRIAFAVSSQVDSRTILDMPGAEKLLGKGDMLYMPIGAARPVRAQGAFIADSEIQALVTWWKAQGKPVYDQDVLQAEKSTAEGEGGEDELLREAARLIVRAGYGSVSLLQRKMKIGYVRAARIVDQLEEKGIVGPAQGSNPREVLVGVDELERLLKGTPTSSR
ncbi:MAG TPA: DNA translocase FtsK, partial [bacterium]|nr:DNA translocase FtsK [bacterium]